MENEQKHKLITELKSRGIKHNPDDIIAITKLVNGEIIFLEKGNQYAGLEHILNRHENDFANRGINKQEISDLIMLAISQGKVLGIQGQKNRKIYEVNYLGKIQYISIDIGNNGYIVSANPTPRKLINKYI